MCTKNYALRSNPTGRPGGVAAHAIEAIFNEYPAGVKENFHTEQVQIYVRAFSSRMIRISWFSWLVESDAISPPIAFKISF